MLSKRLLAWYDAHGRDLPWRSKAGARPDPYHVWLSEIMLQQTTVAAVIPYYQKFLDRWPTVDALARADDTDVMAAWAGLGYYSRARNLLKAARMVVNEFEGRFPPSEDALLRLPGVGAYTAAAVAAIAFDERAVVVDGNVERVMARLHAVETPLPKAKKGLYEIAETHTPKTRSGDYAQAVMDLGATVCTPRNPACGICPLMEGCEARFAHSPTDFPKKLPKQVKPVRQGLVFWLESGAGILLVQRPPKGLLGGMRALPSSPWEAGLDLEAALKEEAPCQVDWSFVPGVVRHSFTHFHLDLTVAMGQGSIVDPVSDGEWVEIDRLLNAGLPTVMKKAVRYALAHRGII